MSPGWVVAALVLGGLLAWVALEVRRLTRGTPEPVARLEAKVEALTVQLGERLGASAEASGRLATLVQGQLTEAGRTMAALGERLGRLDEATRQVERVGQSIAGLERLLASPKRRGIFGEAALEELLAEVLPPAYVLRQHRLPTRGVIVDTAVRTADGRLIPIDSKFPIEAYRRFSEAEGGEEGERERLRRELQRTVRARVDEIATKYISPDDGTLDFALMFIPAESVYYELAVRESGLELAAYARESRVLLCSPGTLYAYLQAILLGIRGVEVARRAREIQAALSHLAQDASEARDCLERAGHQLRNAGSNVELGQKALEKLEARLTGIAAVESGAVDALAPVHAGADRG